MVWFCMTSVRAEPEFGSIFNIITSHIADIVINAAKHPQMPACLPGWRHQAMRDAHAPLICYKTLTPFKPI